MEWNVEWNGMELGLSFPDHQSLPVTAGDEFEAC